MFRIILVIDVINGYSIKNVDGSDVLYLYFDFSFEFSLDNFNFFKRNLEDNILDFIKRNKIDFKGVTVLLISGGILFGSISLNTPTFSSISMENPVSFNESVDLSDDSFYNEFLEDNSNDIVINDNEDVISSNSSDVVNDNIYEESVDNYQKNQKDVTDSFHADSKEIVQSNIVKDDEVKYENVEQNVVQSSYEIDSVTNDSNVKIDNSIEGEVDNNIYVSLRRGGVVSKVELEEYVIGVVGAEMPASFSLDALKAQAIIARTYALKANQRGIVLSDNESSQSYKSDDQLHSMWGSSFDLYFNKVRDAVLSTKGMYLSYNGDFIDAVYHSTSNGKTESSINVWGNYYPYLVSVDSGYDSFNSSFEKKVSFSYSELSNKLGFDINSDSSFIVLDRTDGDRVKSISIDGHIFSGIEVRSILGLRSADFDIEKNLDGVSITTRGYGHGVGLSQYGANGMALNGFSYIDILKHYYSGVSIDYL